MSDDRLRALEEENVALRRELAEARRRERELTEGFEAEVAVRTAEAEDAKAAAEAASQAKSQFLANMSHELRTPLNVVIGYAEMLLEDGDELGASVIDDLEKIQRAGRHLLGLINDILDLSKIEAGKMDLAWEPVDVDALVHEVTSVIEPLAAQNRNRFRYSGRDLGTTWADGTRIRQVLFNLLSNACKFTSDGEVQLSAARRINEGEREELIFAVADTGVGMDDETLAKLFRPFTQADASTTRRYGGTGLGLAISKRFCEMMGGSIHVRSVVGSGSSFTVRIPVRGRAPSRPALLMAQALEEGQGPRVLCVGGAPARRERLRRGLLDLGCQVGISAGAGEALGRLRRTSHDLVVLLDQPPSADRSGGREAFLEALGRIPRVKPVPVFVEGPLGVPSPPDVTILPVGDEALLAALSRWLR
ncbi:MAG: hypothetical protein KF901_23410 [Myxococcales bacterium]|nr:hypothetical protein [Myxococcales bacterium]